MSVISKKSGALFLLAMLTVPASGSLSAQDELPSATAGQTQTDQVLTTVPARLRPTCPAWPKDPRSTASFPRAAATGCKSRAPTAPARSVALSDGTEIKGSGGFLGLNHKQLDADSLLNGLPVNVKTVQWGGRPGGEPDQAQEQ